jgi:hypothetical protein
MPETITFSNECPICGKNCNISNNAIISPFISQRAFNFEPFQIKKKKWGLREISNGTNYFPCKSVFCKNCIFLFSNLRFNKQQLTKIYHDYRGTEYTKSRSKFEKNYKKRNLDLKKNYPYLKDVENYILKFIKKPVSVLDWGGGAGNNTPFKNSLKKFHIYDISKVKIVNNAKVVEYKNINKSYDLVICSNVLEHTPNIEDILLKMRKKIKLGARFYFELPFENIMLNLNKANHMRFLKQKRHWHEHINFFSKISLKKLLIKCGYKIINIRSTKVPYYNNKEMNILQAITY